MVTGPIRRSLAIIVGLALLLALSGSISPPPAHASGALTTPFLACDTGYNQFLCSAMARGGTAPYSYTWQSSSNASITSSIHGSSVGGICTSGQFFTIGVTVQDSLGATATKNISTLCRSGPWT